MNRLLQLLLLLEVITLLLEVITLLILLLEDMTTLRQHGISIIHQCCIALNISHACILTSRLG